MYERGKYSYGAQRKKTVEERFWQKVDKRGEDECWEWLGARASGRKNFLGYGIINVSGVLTLTHRYSFELHNGYIDPDLLVCHSCDNGLCVNYKHLWQGTHKDNSDDKIKKAQAGGRVLVPKEKRGRHKLTLSQVLEIRRLRVTDRKTYLVRVLASMFNVSNDTIINVTNFHTWKEN